MSIIQLAKETAQKYHEGQKYNDEPYFNHVERVAQRVMTDLRANYLTTLHLIRVATAVAYLHDIVEDTEFTLNDVKQAFGDEVAYAVDSITHRPDEEYIQYIHRIAEQSKFKSKIAKIVKMADLRENISQCLLPSCPKEKKGLLKRYEKALAYLEQN